MGIGWGLADCLGGRGHYCPTLLSFPSTFKLTYFDTAPLHQHFPSSLNIRQTELPKLSFVVRPMPAVPACALLIDIFQWIEFAGNWCLKILIKAPQWDAGQIFLPFNIALLCKTANRTCSCIKVYPSLNWQFIICHLRLWRSVFWRLLSKRTIGLRFTSLRKSLNDTVNKCVNKYRNICNVILMLVC